MANKALGRDLGHLLSRARPARIVERAAGAPPTAAGPVPAPPPSPPQENLELPLDPPPAPPRAAPVPAVSAPPAAPAPPLPAVPAGPLPLPSTPRAPRRSAAFGSLLAADLLLLAVAAWLALGDAVPRPLAWYLAAAAVLAGGLCGVLAFLLRDRRPAVPDQPAAGQKVRVQLRRL